MFYKYETMRKYQDSNKNTGPEAIAVNRRWIVGIILRSMKLQSIKRFYRQRFWEKETRASDYADSIEDGHRLESVAEHSWHVADILMLVGPMLGNVDIGRCVELAVVHDKLELILGDISPLGQDGTGQKSHAFNSAKQNRKLMLEAEAAERYLVSLPAAMREYQKQLLDEVARGETWEARLVKAIDALQPLCFVLQKRKGNLQDRHLLFTIQYAARAIDRYPEVRPIYEELIAKLLRQVARKRRSDEKRQRDSLLVRQRNLPFDSPEALTISMVRPSATQE